MHADRAALLRTVLADPKDDAPRLVFADWLDEHGEPERAAFIRAQCTGDDVRATALLAAHGAAWASSGSSLSSSEAIRSPVGVFGPG